MKTITRMELKPGMVLGADVLYQGNILFPAKTKLDNGMIHKLQRYSILCVTVLENVDMAYTHYERIQYDAKFKEFEKAHNEALLSYKDAFMNFLYKGSKIPDDLLMNIYESLAVMIPNGSVLLDYLYNLMPNEDELTFNQCLNSALLAGTF
nr:hypothetical protein [Acetatifactor sp.]